MVKNIDATWMLLHDMLLHGCKYINIGHRRRRRRRKKRTNHPRGDGGWEEEKKNFRSGSANRFEVNNFWEWPLTSGKWRGRVAAQNSHSP